MPRHRTGPSAGGGAVKETIYLAVSRTKIERMTKRLPDLQRGEIPVKLLIEVDPAAFGEPVLEQHVRVTDWREGIDIRPVDVQDGIITEREAAMIRETRLAELTAILEARGYMITPPVAAAAGQEEGLTA
jgi:hypothetical protein